MFINCTYSRQINNTKYKWNNRDINRTTVAATAASARAVASDTKFARTGQDRTGQDRTTAHTRDARNCSVTDCDGVPSEYDAVPSYLGELEVHHTVTRSRQSKD